MIASQFFISFVHRYQFVSAGRVYVTSFAIRSLFTHHKFNVCSSFTQQGFHRVPNVGYDFNTGQGIPFAYFTCGAACSEVEIDILTGDFHILRADLLMDLGDSLNPAIDIGQIEGAFVQGVGWCTMEELIWGDEDHKWVKPGTLATRGPGAYKIPSFNDIPIDFRVTLLPDSPNPFAVHSSKAVGEPPLFLSASVFFAIQEAVLAARREAMNGDVADEFVMYSPATTERIRMAIGDEISRLYTKNRGQGEKDAYQPRGSW